MEFLPRIMQRVVFCLCESYGRFFVKFTKCYSLVRVMLSLNILVHGEFPSWPNSVVYGRISLCVLVLGRAKVVSSMLWMTKQG